MGAIKVNDTVEIINPSDALFGQRGVVVQTRGHVVVVRMADGKGRMYGKSAVRVIRCITENQ